MEIDQKQIAILIKIARKNGVKKIKIGDLELELGDKPKRRTSAPSIGKPISDIGTEPMPSDDELLYYSSGYDPNANKHKEVL